MQNLNNLHHDPLSVRLMAGLISLAQVEAHSLGVLLRDLFHNHDLFVNFDLYVNFDFIVTFDIFVNFDIFTHRLLIF